MCKQILVCIALLSFCKMGLSYINDPELKELQSNLRNAISNSMDLQKSLHNSTISEIKKVQTALATNGSSIDASTKQNTAQIQGLEQRLDRIILCNTKLIEFLAQKDHAIASTQDALTLVDKSKQLLEEELISKNERIAFLEDALRSLKERMEDLTVENEAIRADLEASIQGLQLKLQQ